MREASKQDEGSKQGEATPWSVSVQTIPSKVTLVPGSHGPRHSGSVTTPTSFLSGGRPTSATPSGGEQSVFCKARQPRVRYRVTNILCQMKRNIYYKEGL